MHNCGLLGGLGRGHTLRPHSNCLQSHTASRPCLTPARSAQATAAVVLSSTDESSMRVGETAAQQAAAEAPEASSTTAAASRRRRRSATSAVDAAAQVEPTAAGSRQAQGKVRKTKKPAQQQDYQLLFQQPDPSITTRVRRVSKTKPAALPAGAEQDATKVLAANRKAAAEARAQAQLQAIDPQLLADFSPFAQSFQAAVRPLTQPQASTAQDATRAAEPGNSQHATQQQQEQVQEQQQRPPTARRSKRDFIELFTPAPTGPQTTQKFFSRDAPPALLPEGARRGAQRLATLIATQQQRKQQQAQPAADDAAEQQQPAAAGAGAIQQDIGTPLFGRQAGVTTIYTPVPAKGAAKSAAERQPLRLMSLRQQQQAREEARRQAVMMLRERSQREYEVILQAMLNWQPSTINRYYIPDAPPHFPVVVQRQWDALNSSSSSSSSSDLAPSAGAAAAEPAVLRQPSAEDQQMLTRISGVLQQQLGVGLPDRALRGERSAVIVSLAPEAVKERLGAWVGCCGKDYVMQLMSKEPTLLGQEPKVLLSTLQAVSSLMQLSPQESVALMLKQPALIGLDAAELRERLQGLADAVGCERSKAARLASHTASLIMMHPDYIKERMAALAKLMPEAAAKLPGDVVRHPFLLARSPRAIARSILEMSDTLELSSWATCRLVAGQAILLNMNFDTLRNRLDKLRQVTLPVRRWNRELQAMSPPSLARCLSASDAAIARLQQLVDIGAANSRTLPPLNKILTMPSEWWEVRIAEVAAAKEQMAERRATAAAAAAAGSAGGSADSWDEAPGAGSSVAQVAHVSAARALSRVRSQAASPTSAGAAVSSSQSFEDEEVMGRQSDGLLGGDAAWKSSLQNAILGAAAELGKPWFSAKAAAAAGQKGGRQQQQQEEREGQQHEAAAAGASRYRRRR